jgi:hypothetical protein
MLALILFGTSSYATGSSDVGAYDWYDNGKNADIAYPKHDGHPTLHNHATEGLGTYADPVTIAAHKTDFPIGSYLYVPLFQKYFIMEDQASKGSVKIWVGPSNASASKTKLLDCAALVAGDGNETILGPSPSKTLLVDTTPLFDAVADKCTVQMHTDPTPAPVPTPPLPPSPAAPTPGPLPNGTVMAEFTFYGALDNCPPGGDIAYPKLHKEAGGTGTFADPITFAGAEKAMKPGTIIYAPQFMKYFIFEDSCEECEEDWKSKKKYHADLWMGPDTLGQGPLIACENTLTSNKLRPMVSAVGNAVGESAPSVVSSSAVGEFVPSVVSRRVDFKCHYEPRSPIHLLPSILSLSSLGPDHHQYIRWVLTTR